MPFIPDPKIDARFPYNMECLACGKVAEDVMPESLNGVTNLLVRMQEHLMVAHGADQTEFAQHTQRKVQNAVTQDWTWYYIRPDGTDWLKARMRKKYLNEPNPAVAVLFQFQDGPVLRWRLERPWQQLDVFTEIGFLGAKYALGITLDLPPLIRNYEDIELAHDCLRGWVMGVAPEDMDEEALQPTHAALDVLCWVLGHDHNTTFGDNLEKLGWRQMTKVEEEGEDAESI